MNRLVVLVYVDHDFGHLGRCAVLSVGDGDFTPCRDNVTVGLVLMGMLMSSYHRIN